jgi:esterase
MTALQDRTISLPALTLHYREAGVEDAPPLILLHGLGGTVAFLFSERWPDRIVRLVSIDTAPPFVGDSSLDAFDAGADDDEKSDDSPTFDPKVWKTILQQLRQPDPSWWSELPEIMAPTLVIGGGSTSHVPPGETG